MAKITFVLLEGFHPCDPRIADAVWGPNRSRPKTLRDVPLHEREGFLKQREIERRKRR